MPQRYSRQALAATTALLTVSLLAACTPSDRFQAGHPVSPEELESIRLAVETWTPTGTYADGTVFWLEQSLIYHTNPQCLRLSNASHVSLGTVADAEAEGKIHACSACDRETESHPVTEFYTDPDLS